jgi:tRNA (mo5U34)-methyltransferase
MDRQEKVAKINGRSWYHSIEIEPGLVTPGRLSLGGLRTTLQRVQMPASLEGLTVLDIGAWDGFYSFEAERRGAKRVVAYDLVPPEMHGFATARELLGSRVEYVRGSVYDLSPAVCGTFDVVFFFGVFYHLRYPLLALDRIWSVAKDTLLLESNCMDEHLVLPAGKAAPLNKIDARLQQIPLYRFYRKDELVPGDFSNWFSPNAKAIEEGLWSAGFEPTLLGIWGRRVAFRGKKVASHQEYLMFPTYEGYEETELHPGEKVKVS